MMKAGIIEEMMEDTMEMSKEMMKAGIIEEMMEDTMESITDADDMEEEANEEIDKVLYELTAGKLGEAPAAVKDTLPAPVAEPEVADEESEDDMEEMQNRLQALRS